MDKKNRLILVLTGLVIIFGAFYTVEYRGRREDNQNYKSIVEEQQSQITYHKNKAGEEYAKKVAAEGDIKTLKSAYGKEIREIKNALGIQSKAIKAIVRVSTLTTGSGNGKIDTVYVRDEKTGNTITSIDISDTTDWFSINGRVDFSGFRYTYQTRDSITLVPYKDGKKTYVKGISANPNTKITGLQGILVHEEKRNKRFGIGPSIQVGYDEGIRITPGVSVQWSVIRF